MKKALVILILCSILVSVLLSGCGPVVTGSGVLVTENYDYEDFTKVAAHNGFQLEVIQSTSFSVEVTTDDNITEYLEVEKSGDTLDIKLKWNRSYHSVTIKAKVTMPDVEGITLSGGSQGKVTGFSSSNDFSVVLSGGSVLEGDIKAADTEFDMSGGSRVTLSGSGEDLTIKSSGGSKAILESFPVNNAKINISGGGSADIYIAGTLDARLSGGSKVLYSGEPKLGDLNLSGGSTIRKK